MQKHQRSATLALLETPLSSRVRLDGTKCHCEKGKVYESEEARISYEELYKKTWFAQNKADVLVRPNLKGQYRTIDRAEKENWRKPKCLQNALW